MKERFSVVLKGRQYFVVDDRSGMTMGGPYDHYLDAIRQANQLQQSMGGQ
jgi:hypothetical protein